MNSLRYALLLIAAVPFIPWMLWKAARIKKSIPKLKEPTDIQGITTANQKYKLNLLSLGESTIAGVGVDTHQKGLTGQLANYLAKQGQAKVHWKVFAKSGWTAATLSEKIIKENLSFYPDLILVGLGGNDAFQFNSPAKWNRDLRGLIGNIQTKFPHIPIVFANLPPTSYFPAFPPLIRFFIGRLTELHRKELIQLSKIIPQVKFCEEKIALKKWHQSVTDLDELFADGIHPSELTYRLWAEEIGRTLKLDLVGTKKSRIFQENSG